VCLTIKNCWFWEIFEIFESCEMKIISSVLLQHYLTLISLNAKKTLCQNFCPSRCSTKFYKREATAFKWG
jgi:hypothetical protein